MDEAETLARDRRLYQLHAATWIIGFVGWMGALALSGMVVPGALAWILVGFSVLLVVSGGLAIKVGRTLVSKSAEHTEGLDLEGDPGDALVTPGIWSTNLWPFLTNAVAPYLFFLVGIVLLALSSWLALR